MFRNFGAPEILILLFIILLLFGAKRLPDMARGMGRSLRIFKAETKGLTDDSDETRSADQAPTPPPPPTADAASERRSDSDPER
jgi:sec-independent protein translocase protein TatA